jgi:hypothetical protein
MEKYQGDEPELKQRSEVNLFILQCLALHQTTHLLQSHSDSLRPLLISPFLLVYQATQA